MIFKLVNKKAIKLKSELKCGKKIPPKKKPQILMTFFRENEEDILIQYSLFMFIFHILAIFHTKKKPLMGIPQKHKPIFFSLGPYPNGFKRGNSCTFYMTFLCYLLSLQNMVVLKL
jgi:hypothetical protein